MLGSESARERIKPPELLHDGDALANHLACAHVDIYGHLPPGLSPPQILMLHSARDAVVSRLGIEQLVSKAAVNEGGRLLTA